MMEEPLYDKFFQQDNRVRANVTLRQPSNPDQAGKANALAPKLGLPPDVVERNLPTLEQEVYARTAAAAMDKHPVIAKWASDPRNAAIGRDDMTALEKNARYWQDRLANQGTLTEVRPTEVNAWNYLKGLGISAIEGVKQLGAFTNQALADSSPDTPANAYWRQQANIEAQRLAGRIDDSTPNFKSRTARAVYGGLSSTINLAPAMAASIATGNPIPMLAYGSALQGAPAYSKYRARGA